MNRSNFASKADLLRHIESGSDQHLQILQQLIRTPTPNPPGDTREAIELVQRLLAQHGISSEIIAPKDNSPNLVSVFEAEGDADQRSIVLNGHVDQFPVIDAGAWERDPYSGDIEEGHVYGRSGVDMKAGTAASMIAYAHPHGARSQLSGRCVLEVVSDEENGGRWGTRHLIEDEERSRLFRGDCVLIGEPGGINSIRFGEKGTLRCVLTVTAQDGHGAYIHRSEGAIRIAARLSDRLVALEKIHESGMDKDLVEYFQRPAVRKVADGIMGEGAADAMLIPTVNVGMIRGGAKINMIPAECVFEADIRIPIGMETQVILNQIDEILSSFPGTKYDIIENHSHVSTYSPREHKLVRLPQKNVELVGGQTPIPICSLGATDGKHFRRNGVPAYAYGPSPKGMAKRDEKVSIQEFLHLVKVHTLTAWDYLGGPQ